ncbi:phage protein [Arsenophonus sp.]|uniref:phage protein n=1 Tax=Arsenophonus sp. TaxID=1872640 RepID=UPI00387A58DA
MSKNWIRKCSLIISDEKGEGIELSDFRATFNITWSDTHYPRTGVFKVWNLRKETVSQIQAKEFVNIQLMAGYQDNTGLIFTGKIRYTISGRDNPTDTFVIVQAIDSHEAYDYATLNTTLSAVHTQAEQHNTLLTGLAPYGIVKGVTPEFDSIRFPRGKVYFGMVRDAADNLAGQCLASWQYINGQLVMVPENKYVQEAIVINSATGLIGLSQQTIEAGINVRCLINPNIQINGLIRLDQALIYRTMLPNSDIALGDSKLSENDDGGLRQTQGAVSQPASLSTDGDYIVKNITYTGDTRGKPWYMDLVCIAKGSNDRIDIKKVG